MENIDLIIYCCSPGGLTGSPKRLFLLAKALSVYGHSPILVSESGSEILAYCKRTNIPSFGLRPRKSVVRRRLLENVSLSSVFRVAADFIFASFDFYFFLLRDSFCTALIVRGSKSALIAMIPAIISRTPVIYDIDYEPSSFVFKFINSLSVLFSQVTVVQYDDARNDIVFPWLKFLLDKKIKSVLPGIDTSSLASESELTPMGFVDRLMPPFDSTRPIVRILHPATICRRKNQIFSVQLISRLSILRPGCRFELVLAGNPACSDYFNQIKVLIDDSNLSQSVSFAGWVPNISESFGDFHFVILPSTHEGVSNVLQEAMLFGLPVIASDIAGSRSIIENGVNGWLLPIDDPEPWAELLLCVLRKPLIYQRISAEAAQYARQNFSLDSWATSYSSLIRESLVYRPGNKS